jgi:hypothetical protein
MTLRQTLRLLPLLTCLVAADAHAQGPTYHPPVDPHNVTAPNLNRPIDLTANWLIHQGDYPAYASPTFDDSHWTVIDINKPLNTYGIVHPNFVWYRTHVHIPPHQHNLAILFRDFRGSEQVFVNGVPAGLTTDFPRGGRYSENPDRRSSLPDDLVASGDLTIAVRGQIQTVTEGYNASPGFGPYTTLSLGDSTVLSDQTALYVFRAFTSNAINLALTGLILLIAISFALALRHEREYLALCLYLGGAFFADAITIYQSSHFVIDSRWSTFPSHIFTFISTIAGMEFARMVLRLPRSRWIVAYEWTLGVCMVCGTVLDILTFDIPTIPKSVLLAVIVVVTILIAPPSDSCVVDRLSTAERGCPSALRPSAYSRTLPIRSDRS